MFDLATSIVYTRQGNPAWAGTERDGLAPRRSDDMFFGASASDPQPDWVDLNKIAIPQADEQQRFLANLITDMNADRKPLPRFWYFPNAYRAVVVMTGDDHGYLYTNGGGTAERFEQFLSLSQPGCSFANWECIRGTSYLFTDGALTDAQAGLVPGAGFRSSVCTSPRSSGGNCVDYTPTSLAQIYNDQKLAFFNKFTSITAAEHRAPSLHRVERLGDAARRWSWPTASGSTRRTTTGPVTGCRTRPGTSPARPCRCVSPISTAA